MRHWPAWALSIAATAAAADAPPPQEHPVLAEIAGAVSAAQLQASVQALVGFGTRHTASDPKPAARGIGAARRWAQQRFAAIAADCGGCLSVVTPAQTVTGARLPVPTDIVDVVAVQRGSGQPERVVLITGHIDSRVSDVANATADAPGADDDASGVAAVLEAARVLSRYRFAATIVYGVLSGEEQGLYGGKLLAQYARDQGWQVEADLNNDIVGASRGGNGVVDNTRVRLFSEATRPDETAAEARRRRFEGGELDGPSRNLARYAKRIAEAALPNWRVDLVYRVDRFGRGGDHEAFNELGMPALRFTEGAEDYRHQHQDLRRADGADYGDTIDHLDFDYLARVTASNAVTLAALAWAPAPPAQLEIAGAVTPDTVLKWKAAGEGVAGYRVYWRDTAEPAWSHARWVGKVAEARLAGLAIDDFSFGVAAVSADGFESPVEFPGPVGAFTRVPPVPDAGASK
ncbi:MAG: M20/M25/M40 family metallo-hydrolase [Nevskia sp.]|nr:M20/M25/M40 family metallo-hydrolase [Nevskia sp.]